MCNPSKISLRKDTYKLRFRVVEESSLKKSLRVTKLESS